MPVQPLDVLLSSDEIRHLLSGSYESQIHRIESAVVEGAEELFGKNVGVALIGTFSGHALVLSETGKLLRVKFDDKGPKVQILAHEEVPLKTVRSFKAEELVHAQSKVVVDSLLSGRVDEAVGGISRLAALPSRRKVDGLRLVESLVMSLHTDRPWRRLYSEQGDKIRRFVWGDLFRIEDERLRPKYGKLHDGSTPDEALEQHRKAVAEDLQSVLNRMDRLSKIVDEASKGLVEFKDAFSEIGEDALREVFYSFVEDLLDDIGAVRGMVAETMNETTCVACLAKMYDSMCEELYRFELAATFASRISSRLRAAQESGGRS